MRQIAPYLSKITDGIDAMGKEYGVDECILMIRGKMVPTEKDPSKLEKKAFLVFMSVNPVTKSLEMCRDKNGKPAEYSIEQLPKLFSGGTIGNDDDEFED